MPFLLVAARKLATASFTCEGLLTCMSANVGGEVIGATEGPHTDATLEGLLARVDANVAGEFVASRKPAVAAVDGASVRALVQGRLGRTVGVFAGLHRKQLQGHIAALVGLTKDFMALAGALIVFR